MRQRKRSITGGWVIGLVVFLLAGCGGDDNGTKPTGTPGNPATMPFDVGNRWNYRTVIEDDAGDQDAYLQYQEIIDTKQFGGKNYYQLRTIQIGAVAGDTTAVVESYIRQEDQSLYVYDDIDTTGAGLDEFDQFYARLVMESRPWKIAEFTSLSGETWEVMNGQETWDLEGGGTQSLTVKVTASNDGRAEIVVPAGTYDDVYKGVLEVTFTMNQNIPPLAPLEVVVAQTQTIYIKDRIGIVKEEGVSWYSQGGVEQQRVTTVSDLKNYDVQP